MRAAAAFWGQRRSGLWPKILTRGSFTGIADQPPSERKPLGNSGGAPICVGCWMPVTAMRPCTRGAGRGRGPTIDNSVDAALLEGHDVLGECARLVREDVLHLAQQVVEAGASRFGGQVLGLIVHVLVPVDEDAVPQVDEFCPADARMHTRTLGGHRLALEPAVPPPPSIPAQQGAGGPGAHITNMAMGTRTLSRMRKPQKMKKASTATLLVCMADT